MDRMEQSGVYMRPTPKKVESNLSLYQQTMDLIAKLYSIPRFERYLFPEGIDVLVETAQKSGMPPIPDPTAVLWHCFRLGSPLCHLFNHLHPSHYLEVPSVEGMTTYTNVCKKSFFHFMEGCKEQNIATVDECLNISELYKDDTNGLVKVMHLVTLVLNEIERKGFLPPSKPLPFASSNSLQPTDNRSKLLKELLDTERAYLNSLSELNDYQATLEASQKVSKDLVYDMFGNLSEVLDFQRRFLIALEGTLSLGPRENRVGAIFMAHVPCSNSGRRFLRL